MLSHHVHRVLIIDDSLDTQYLLRTILESKGYLVDCSSNGAEALSLLQCHGELPDVILLDIRMPVMDGFGFLSSQSQNQRLRDIPTVVMTADAESEKARLQCKSSDVVRSHEVLKKPLSMASVLDAVERNCSLS